MTPEQAKARERYWRRQFAHNIEAFEALEFEWIDDGATPSIQEEVNRSYSGWSLGGYNGMRHWSRPKRNRIRVKAGRREISMDEYHAILFTAFLRGGLLWCEPQGTTQSFRLKPYKRVEVNSGKLDWME